MLVISLQSGSSGNCTYVEAGGMALLFDAGISGARAERRLAAHGRDIRNVDALIVSHDHADHVRYAGVYQRKYGIPLYMTRGTLEAAAERHLMGKVEMVHHFRAGDALQFKGVTVETVPTMHDGEDGVAFVVSSDRKRLGILTDLGHVFDGLHEVVATLDAVILESNYDPAMLRHGPYPEFLKRRISGPSGHLSNLEAANLLKEAGGRLRWACLAHLSEQNNRPELALEANRRAVGPRLPLRCASRYQSTSLLSV